MITIDARGTDLTIKALTKFARSGIISALVAGANTTIKSIHKEEERTLPLEINKPTPFTKRSMLVVEATTKRRTARVFLKRLQNEYLQYPIAGGIAPVRLIPVLRNKPKMTPYGNLFKKKQGLEAIKLATPKTFISDKIGGKVALWRRTKRKGKEELQMLIYYAKFAPRKQRWKFLEHGEKIAIAELGKNITIELNKPIYFRLTP